MGRDVHCLVLSIRHFLCKGALKDGFGEAVVTCDMPEACKFPSPDGCQRRFLWTHKEADLVPHTVVCLYKAWSQYEDKFACFFGLLNPTAMLHVVAYCRMSAVLISALTVHSTLFFGSPL